MERVKVGDPVTVAYTRTNEVDYGEVTYIYDADVWLKVTTLMFQEIPRRIADEGTTWVRGHSGEVVDAFLAAVALR